MATDRLRRRLGALSADTLASLTPSSSSSTLCIVGTPLPALVGPSSTKRDANELKPVWQQEAYDAQGRRRFHGAFTGGWSAGYFNTVGSKDGWTPASFRSSRGQRHDAADGGGGAGSKVEDFMDEEDLADWKANQHVTVEPPAVGLDQIAGLRQAGSSATMGAGEEVAMVSGEQVGYRLLRRMGWRPGQELGSSTSKPATIGSATATSSRVTLEDPASSSSSSSSFASQTQTSRRGLGAHGQPTLAQVLSKHPPLRSTPEAAVESAGDEADVWSDGRPLLSGFQLARLPPPKLPVFETPPIPEGWQPDPQRVLARSTSQAGPRNPTPATRGHLLGEAKIPGPPPNIAAFLSAKAREHLASHAGVSLPSTESCIPESIEVPPLDPTTARLALEGSFAPFKADPAKQQRYAAYLESQCSPNQAQAKRLQVPAELTAEQFASEVREYAKSAAMFRPMSSAIASRFTRASASAMEHEGRATGGAAGLRQGVPASAVKAGRANEEDRKEPEKELSVAQRAAKMGNFGHLTRTVQAWAPERLLCKRFGVPEPTSSRKRKDEAHAAGSRPDPAQRPELDDDPDPFYGSTQSSRSKSKSIRVDQHWERSKEQLKALAAGPTPLSLDAQALSSRNAPHIPTSLDEAVQEDAIGMGNDERQGRDTLTYVKPTMDVYKSIFASDEEASDAEDAATTRNMAATTKPKWQDPASGSGVVFQARFKRKDVDARDGAEKLGDAALSTTPAVPVDKKRKKDKSSKKKALLTFDFDDGDDHGDTTPAAPPTSSASSIKTKTKPRMKAADLF